MNLSEFKQHLQKLDTITFELPNGITVPPYFHVTEVGKITREFIDCGGTLRKESKINFQLWTSTDYDHRLTAEKLIAIIEKSEKAINLTDLPIEIEYQSNTIGKYHVDFNGTHFLLINQATACLAEDACGIPQEKQKRTLSEITTSTSCCTPDTGCC